MSIISSGTLGQGVTSAGTSGATTSHNRNCLGTEIKLGREEVRNKRIMSGAFQNYDQKSQTLYDTIAQVLKTMSEMR